MTWNNKQRSGFSKDTTNGPSKLLNLEGSADQDHS